MGKNVSTLETHALNDSNVLRVGISTGGSVFFTHGWVFVVYG